MSSLPDSHNGLTDRASPASSRIRAAAEAIGIMVAAMSTLWIAAAIPGWVRWEQTMLGGTWLVQILAFMVVPLVAVHLLGGRAGRLGITFGGIARPVETALTALAVVGPANGAAFPLLGVLGWSPLGWRGGLVLAAVYAVSLPLTGLLIRKIRPTADDTLPLPHLGMAAGVLAVAIAASASTADSAPVVSAVLLVLLVVGPGEELLFRGVVQTRLDQALGRPWRIFGAELGWGWVIASLLFGLAHFLSPTTFGHGGWALWTAVSGLLFGYIRAKSGSFVASGLVHGVLLAVAAVLAELTAN